MMIIMCVLTLLEQFIFIRAFLIRAARTGLFHTEPRFLHWPHNSAGAAASALQRGATVGDD